MQNHTLSLPSQKLCWNQPFWFHWTDGQVPSSIRTFPSQGLLHTWAAFQWLLCAQEGSTSPWDTSPRQSAWPKQQSVCPRTSRKPQPWVFNRRKANTGTTRFLAPNVRFIIPKAPICLWRPKDTDWETARAASNLPKILKFLNNVTVRKTQGFLTEKLRWAKSSLSAEDTYCTYSQRWLYLIPAIAQGTKIVAIFPSVTYVRIKVVRVGSDCFLLLCCDLHLKQDWNSTFSHLQARFNQKNTTQQLFAVLLVAA